MKTTLCALLVSLIAAFNVTAATISGTVTPGGMTVAAYDSNGMLAATTVAAPDGQYALTVASGHYRVLAYDPAGVYATAFYSGADSFESSLLLDVRTTASPVNLTLVRAGFATGSVTSASASLPDITIAAYNLSGTRRAFTRTDAAGQYRLVLPPGTYKLVAYDDAKVFATSFYAGQTTFASATTVAVHEGTDSAAHFSLVAAGRVSGVVRDAATQAVLQNIRVRAYDGAGIAIASAQSDAMGRYELVLAPGAYRVVFDDADGGVYASVYWPDAGSFVEAATVVAVASQTTTVDAALTRGARITGAVRDAATGVALPNITVAAFNASGTMRTTQLTDATGGYSLLVPPGTYRVGAFDTALTWATTFYPQQPLFAAATQLSVVSGQTASGLDLTMTRGGRLSGAVRDVATGAALRDITVGAFDGAGTLIASAVTREDGSFRFVAAPGAYRIVAFDPALRYVASAYGDVTLAAGQELSAVTFALTAGASATGVVRDHTTSAPLAGLLVSAFDSNGVEVAATTTDALGRYGLALPAGTYRLAASDPLRRYATGFFENAASFAEARAVTVAAGQSFTADFTLAKSARSARRRSARH